MVSDIWYVNIQQLVKNGHTYLNRKKKTTWYIFLNNHKLVQTLHLNNLEVRWLEFFLNLFRLKVSIFIGHVVKLVNFFRRKNTIVLHVWKAINHNFFWHWAKREPLFDADWGIYSTVLNWRVIGPQIDTSSYQVVWVVGPAETTRPW